VLQPLGVDEATFAVYHALLREPDSTPEQLCTRLDCSVDEVAGQLDRLRELGLLVPTWTTPAVSTRSTRGSG
jgi:predicted transcriptional regulator